MSWFSKGLSKNELTKEYRTLAKQYHPDLNLNNPAAAEIMKEINAEYDEYFTSIRKADLRYTPDIYESFFRKYSAQEKTMLLFLKKDKFNPGKFFAYVNGNKAITDSTFDDFNYHRGFALCKLTFNKVVNTINLFGYDITNETVESVVLTKIPAKIRTPSYADMYYGIVHGIVGQNGSLVSTDLESAPIRGYYEFELIETKMYGLVWTSKSIVGKHTRRYAYVLVNDQVIMSTEFDIPEKFIKVVEKVRGDDFGFLAFQNCTMYEFYEMCDVDYVNAPLINAFTMADYKPDELYWIDDPIVAHYARRGFIEFAHAKEYPNMKIGYFKSDPLKCHLEETTVEDTNIVQDYLDKINDDFINRTKNLARKGKIKIVV